MSNTFYHKRLGRVKVESYGMYKDKPYAWVIMLGHNNWPIGGVLKVNRKDLYSKPVRNVFRYKTPKAK